MLKNVCESGNFCCNLFKFSIEPKQLPIVRLPVGCTPVMILSSLLLLLLKTRKIRLVNIIIINQKRASTMGKPKKPKHDSESEEIQDVMAWGKSKNNYYQENEDEYSNASEEQDEAREIYQNQFEELNQDEFFEVADRGLEGEQQQDEEQENDERQVIDKKYIQSEILWAAEIAKLFQPIEDSKSAFRKKIYDNYLLILLCLREFTFPYIEQHPLVAHLPFLKKALTKLEKEIPSLYKDNGLMPSEAGSEDNQEQFQQGRAQQEGSDMEEDEDQEFDEGEDENYDENEDFEIEEQSEEIQKPMKKKGKIDEEGIKIYEEIKQKKEEQRKQKKIEQKKKRQDSLPKQKFKTVSDSEGRLVNEKIIKNKGLMKKRKKIDSNSRVKLRHKYKKALIKRVAKGFRGVRENPGNHYQGEDKVLMGKINSTRL